VRNLLALVGLVVVAFGGLGWYFQWYTFARKIGLDGKTQLTLDVDTRKIAEDAKTAGDRIGSAVQTPPTTPVTTPAADPNGLVGPPAPPWYPPNPPVGPPVGPPAPSWYPLPPAPVPSRGPNR